MQVCSTFEVFNQVMDQCTENFECLVINNTKSNKLSDQVFYKRSDYPTLELVPRLMASS